MKLVIMLKGKVKELQLRIEEFFANNPNPDDSKVHALAEELGISPHALETQIYALLSAKLGTSGKAPGKTAQLAMGVKVEKEHLPTITKIKSHVKLHSTWPEDAQIARWIASDHLDEIPDYYTRLDAMEKEAKGG